MKIVMELSTFTDLATAGVFASTDKVRPILNGVLIEVENGTATATATDSYRLVRITRECVEGENVKVEGETVPLNIPADILAAAAKDLAKYFVKYRGNVVLESDGITFSIYPESGESRRGGHLIEGKYPEVAQLIPELGTIHEIDGGISLNPWLIADIVKLAPWAGTAKKDRGMTSMRVAAINDERRPIAITSQDGQTVIVVMPVVNR
jgi:hypothetical protein